MREKTNLGSLGPPPPVTSVLRDFLTQTSQGRRHTKSKIKSWIWRTHFLDTAADSLAPDLCGTHSICGVIGLFIGLHVYLSTKIIVLYILWYLILYLTCTGMLVYVKHYGIKLPGYLRFDEWKCNHALWRENWL